MNPDIEVTNLTKHFSLIERNSEEEDEPEKYNTKLVKYNFSSINEVTISNIIKTIPYYSNKYLIVEEYEYITIDKLRGTYLEKHTIGGNNNNNKHLILKYKNDKVIEFNHFLFYFTEPKLFLLHTIDSFSYLLHSLLTLHNKNICFFNLSPENIIFNYDCGEKPFIIDFESSLHMPKLNETYITNIIEKVDTYTHKPFEVHILFYLIKNNISSISYSFILEISELFVKHLSILHLFSEKYKENYKEQCIESVKQYINKPKSYIIEDILKRCDTWDVYSISLIYLHIFGNISRVFSLKQTILSKIIVELSKNIHPNPINRSSLLNTTEKYTKALNEEMDWSFIKKMSPEKMPKLFDMLNE